MNPHRAKKIAAQIFNSKIGDWTVEEYINCGKSALVCRASRGDEKRAIKIFDPEIIEKFDRAKQTARIERQLELVGKYHENLIQIYDGGFCRESKYYYIVMGFIDGPTLADLIPQLPREKIGPLIWQIASAAYFLESIDLVHRDIKPENIAIVQVYSKAILLDLGVIRPIGDKNITDSSNTSPFLGTLRYSSPEFLLRKEDDSKEGWRAVTFYQLGAVLHDMIMRQPIFKDQSEPYARLVQAVCRETPIIFATDVNSEIVLLSKNCLVKDPNLRLELINWENFTLPLKARSNLDLAKSRIEKRYKKSTFKSIKSSSDNAIQRHIEQFLYDIKKLCQSTIREICIGNNKFPPLEIHDTDKPDVSSFTFLVSYPLSEEHTLTKPLTIILTANLLDLHSKVVRLEYGGVLSNDRPCRISPPTMTIFFEGVSDKKTIKCKLIEGIYLIFDKAQGKCDSSSYSDNNTAQNNNAYLWITFQCKEEEEINE